MHPSTRALLAFVSLVIVASRANAHLPPPSGDPMRMPAAWLQPPAQRPAEGFDAEKGVKAVYFDGPAYKGKPTRVFAWIGLPEKVEPGKKVPGIVLVHGGGGTAFAEWVRLWTSRGYAAIAMDNCGQVPKGSYGKWERNPDGGPPGWGDFEHMDEPREEQWPYHAVADVILAHSLLRSMPQVDPDRIGITGISWGGYLTCIVAGLDERLKFAVPVYGCGFLGEDSVWKPELERMGERGQKWLAMWDPKHYLNNVKIPTLWMTGTNDFAYPLDSLRRSYLSTRSEAGFSLCVRLRMPHGHGGAGENPKEILAFADSIVRQGRPLPEIGKRGGGDGKVWLVVDEKTPVVSAELLYTTDGEGPWQKREWKSAPATVVKPTTRVEADLPPGTRAYFINVTDDRGLMVSDMHEERAPAAAGAAPARSDTGNGPGKVRP
jgi:dienelactone hydrolase